jgi:hypothetical protein
VQCQDEQKLQSGKSHEIFFQAPFHIALAVIAGKNSMEQDVKIAKKRLNPAAE